MQLDPTRVVRLGIEAVPAVRYALGIAGVAAALALIALFFDSKQAAFFGTAAMFVLMVLLVVFASLTQVASTTLKLPALVLTWAMLLIFVFSTLFVTTSVFADWPKPFREVVEVFFPAPQSRDQPAAEPAGPASSRSESLLSLFVVSRQSGRKEELSVPEGASVAFLKTKIQALFEIPDALPVGTESVIRIQWVIVDERAYEHWTSLELWQQQDLHAIFLTRSGNHGYAWTADTRLEDLDIPNGTIVHLVSVPVNAPEPMMSTITEPE